MFDRGFGRLARRHRAVVNHRRRDAAGADAARGQEGKLVVGCGLTGFDAGLLLDGSDDLVGALHVAGGAHAHDARVLALRLEREEVVERGDAIDAAGRELEVVRHIDQQPVVEETEQLLGLVEDLNECVPFVLVTLHERVEDLEAFVAAGMLGGLFLTPGLDPLPGFAD